MTNNTTKTTKINKINTFSTLAALRAQARKAEALIEALKPVHSFNPEEGEDYHMMVQEAERICGQDAISFQHNWEKR